MTENTPQDDITQRYKPEVALTRTGEPPQRVVSLVPSMTETLFDIGFGDRVVGITDDCLLPEGKVDSKFRVGPIDSVRIDDVVGLRPDLVITNREENAAQNVQQLEAAGLTVWKTFPRTVLEAMNLIWDTLHSFQVDDRMLYERVNLINRSIDWVGSVSEAKDDQGVVCKVFAPLLPDPLTTFGPDTYAHDLVKTAGGTNVFGDRTATGTGDPAEDISRYPTVTMDDVVAAQPDVVVLPGYPLLFTQADVENFSKLDIPAARNGQIYLIDGTLLTYHGTRLARALNELSEIMCPVEEDDDSI